jgi:hypothetical protein
MTDQNPTDSWFEIPAQERQRSYTVGEIRAQAFREAATHILGHSQRYLQLAHGVQIPPSKQHWLHHVKKVEQGVLGEKSSLLAGIAHEIGEMT